MYIYVAIYKYMFFNSNNIIENNIYIPIYGNDVQIKDVSEIRNGELYSCFLDNYAYSMPADYKEYVYLCTKIIFCFILLGVAIAMITLYFSKHAILSFIHDFQMYVEELTIQI